VTPVEGAIVADRFHLVRQLGKGGMGEVWLAHDARLDTPCAVKFLHASGHGGAAVRARFEREARAAAQLRSPNVVQILDHGEYLGEPYIAMEMLQGEDLATRLRRLERIDARDMVVIVAQIAKALTRAHAAGLVHRDLKPANVFIVPDDGGELIKVLDFGVVKSIAAGAPASVRGPALDDGAASATRTGQLMGTPSYMSPEQATADRELDTRSDLWSLGVLTYQCLTGRLPFQGADLGDLVMKILLDPIPKPSESLPSLGPALDTWFVRALAREPSQRFQTARELSDAFAEAVTGALVTSVPPGAQTDQQASSSDLVPAGDVTPAPALAATVAATPIAPPAAARPRRAWPFAALLLAAVGAGGLYLAVRAARDAGSTSERATTPSYLSADSTTISKTAAASETAVSSAHSAPIESPIALSVAASKHVGPLALSWGSAATSASPGKAASGTLVAGCAGLALVDALPGRRGPVTMQLPVGRHDISCRCDNGGTAGHGFTIEPGKTYSSPDPCGRWDDATR